MRPSPVSFKCSSCGAAFADSDGLKAHADLHRRPAVGQQRGTVRPSVVFACTLCHAAFLAPDELKQHVAAHAVQAQSALRAVQAPIATRTVHTPIAACATNARVATRTATAPPDARAVHDPIAVPVAADVVEPQVAATHSPIAPAAPSPAAPRHIEVVPGSLCESRSARLAARRSRRKHARTRIVAALATAAVMVLLLTAVAHAWFTASASVPSRFTIGVWGNCLSFTAGNSRAVHWPTSGDSYLSPIASFDKQGKPALDFGDVRPGATADWPQVFRLTSTAKGPLRVSFVAAGALAPFVRDVDFGAGATVDGLDPGQTRDIGVRLSVPQGASAATISGTLTVTALGERHAIPMTLRILAPQTPPSPSPSGSASPGRQRPGGVLPLFVLKPGLSTVLENGSSTTGAPAAIALVRPDGSLALDFGMVPVAQAIRFCDVARVVSAADNPVKVTLAVSGAAGLSVRKVGFWNARQGTISSAVTLGARRKAQLAFQLDPPPSAQDVQSGTLTILARVAGGQSQTYQLPFVLVVEPTPTPSASASDSPSPSTAPTVSPSTPAPATPSPSDSFSNQPSDSPVPTVPASPSASSSPLRAAFYAPVARFLSARATPRQRIGLPVSD